MESGSGTRRAVALQTPRYRPTRAAMTALLSPRSVAVVGASEQQGSLGQRLLTNLLTWGYEGRVYPINPRYQTLQGLRCYPDLAAVPDRIDCAAFAVSDERIEAAMSAAVAAGVGAGVVFGRLYEPHGPGPSRSERLAKIVHDGGMALCGGNCMGFINAHAGLRISGNPPPVPSRDGRIAYISHSGSTWSGLTGSQRDLDVTYSISAGQELGAGLADYIDYLVDDGSTRAIGLLIETIRDPQAFAAAAARAQAKGVPLVALKLGRSEMGRRFALAHSGALAGSTEIYQAFFERHNIPTCTTLDELTDLLELMSISRRPAGGALGAATDSGAERQLVVDLAADLGCPIASLSPDSEARLTSILDPGMSPTNPVDVYGDGKYVLDQCLQVIADDAAVGIVAVVTNLVAGRPRLLDFTVRAVEQTFQGTSKPVVLLANLHSSVCRESARRLRRQGIAVLMGTSTGLAAIRSALAWHARRTAARDTPIPVSGELIAAWRAKLRQGLDPIDALALYAAFGGPVVPGARAASEAEALAVGRTLGFPLVLKTANPRIGHKTEAGGVVMGLVDGDALVAAYRKISASCGPLVLLQKQAPDGVEVFVGLVGDPQFGPVMTLGLGGIFVEILRDTVTAIPPATPAEIRALLGRLRGFPLLTGARGRPPVDLDRLCDAIASFSRLAAALGDELAEFDLNPLIAGGSGVVAVDALAVPRSHANKTGDQA